MATALALPNLLGVAAPFLNEIVDIEHLDEQVVVDNCQLTRLDYVRGNIHSRVLFRLTRDQADIREGLVALNPQLGPQLQQPHRSSSETVT